MPKIRNPALTAYARDFIARARKDGTTWREIGAQLGITKEGAIAIHAGRNGAGSLTERALADSLHAGSLDSLHRAAKELLASQPTAASLDGTYTCPPVPWPNLASALNKMTSIVSHQTVQLVLDAARKATTDQGELYWIELLVQTERIRRIHSPPKLGPPQGDC